MNKARQGMTATPCCGCMGCVHLIHIFWAGLTALTIAELL